MGVKSSDLPMHEKFKSLFLSIKAENLRLGEPVLNTTIASSMTSPHLPLGRRPSGDQSHDRDRGEAGSRPNRRGLSHDSTWAPSTMTAPSAREVESCFASMLPASRSGTRKYQPGPRPEKRCPCFAAARLTALSKARGPSRIAPVIWPRSAILHRAAASRVEGIFGLIVSTAQRIATLGRSIPRTWAGPPRFVQFQPYPQLWKDVYCSVGNYYWTGICRHIHYKDMTDAFGSAKTGIGFDDRAHEFVRVEASFH